MKPTQQHQATHQMHQLQLMRTAALLDQAKACPVSPCMSAGMGTRLMNNRVILTRTRRQVLEMKARQVVKNMHGNVHGLKLRLALKKTFIGRISKGFDFLGYRFGALGLTGLAQQTIHNHKQRLLLLDEQNASDQRVEKYVSNWLRWTRSGLA